MGIVMNFSSSVSKNVVKMNLESLTNWAHLGSGFWGQKAYARDWMLAHEVDGNLVVLAEGPSSKHP